MRLRVDDWTAEVVEAMRGRGIRPILLKGPAVARWLYGDGGELRTYVDVDLIVSPADTEPARALLVELGYAALPHPPLDDHALHARPFKRDRDQAQVDLHRTLHGFQDLSPERAWEAVSTETEQMHVGGLEVEVPAVRVRILQLVLHLGALDGPESQAWHDLERGIARIDIEDWAAATELAGELGVEHEIAVRLRRLPQGAQLADRLALTRQGSAYYRLSGAVNSGRAPESVLSIFGFFSLADNRARLAYAKAKLLPDDQLLREKSTLARRGHLRLARVARIIGVGIRLPRTLVAWVLHYRR